MSKLRVAGVGIVAAVVGVLAFQFLNAETPVAHSQHVSSTRGFLGQQLADALGLEPIYTNRVDGCGQFTESGDFGYCLDAIVGRDNLAAQILASRLDGHEPSPTELRYFELRAEFARLGEEPQSDDREARRIAIAHEMSDLQVQLDS